MKENFNLFCKIVSRISIRSWEEWVKGFSNLFNKILYDLKPGMSKKCDWLTTTGLLFFILSVTEISDWILNIFPFLFF
jgi:hypothetical protein